MNQDKTRMSNQNAAHNQSLPTGYFTHDRIDMVNPLENAPESPDRLDRIENNMIAMGLDERVLRVEAEQAPLDVVTLAHDEDYVENLKKASEGDEEALSHFTSPDTKVGPGTFDAAMKSAGAVVTAIDWLMTGKIANAFCGIRPPGHHAGRREARGFCYLNNVAIGALYALKQYGLERVAIIDFDVHHGDGTEEILGGDDRVRLMSLFQWPLYPNKLPEPRPANVMDAKLEAGADGQDLTALIERVWLPALENFKPQLILLSAGFDAHCEEQIAQLKMKESDYARLTRRLLDAADVLCDGRLISVLEGGYAVRSLARSAMTHLNTLVRRCAGC